MISYSTIRTTPELPLDGLPQSERPIYSTQTIIPENMRAAEKLYINKFADALACLDDIQTIHTDPNLTSIRRGMRDVLQHDRSEPVTDHLIQAFELYGIAQALAFRFEGTMHYGSAKGALGNAGMLFEDVCDLFQSAAAPGGDLEDGFYELLRLSLDWVPHQNFLAKDDRASSCLCPITAYLQQITWATDMEHWAAGAPGNSEEESPLGVAWEWARASPTIGRQTADVAVLVTMGCRIKMHMWSSHLWVVPREKKEVGIWEAVWAAGSCLLNGGASVSQSSYVPVSEPVQKRDIEAERQAAEQSVDLLLQAGERYSLLLGANDPAQERVEVDCIRSWTELIAAKAAPLTPESVLQLIPSLGQGV